MPSFAPDWLCLWGLGDVVRVVAPASPLTGTAVAPVLYNLIKLSPGPLQHCAGDFWQMVWEQGVSEVIMLATADNEDVSTVINFGNAILGVPKF